MQTSFRLAFPDGIEEDCFQRLINHPQFKIAKNKSKLTVEELEEEISSIEGLVVRSATKVDAAFLSKATKLRYVIRAGEGVDNIDLSLCKNKNIQVSNTPGANNNSAAEHAVALMLSLLRKVPWAHQSMQRGEWDKSAFSGRELSFKNVGIVGFGRIGQIVAKRISGFEVNTFFYDPFVKSSSHTQAQKVESLEDLFSRVDIVTIHVPLMPQTKNLIDGKVLQNLKKEAILINCSRGGIVVENDLYECLKNKKILGAALDVFQTEPLAKDSPWRTLDNVILTPHLGASTVEAQMRIGPMVYEQLISFFQNGKTLNAVEIR